MITTALHPVFELVGSMPREEVIARVKPYATSEPSWDERTQRLIVPVSGVGLFPKLEMTFVPQGLRAVFFKVAWSCEFDAFVERAKELEGWLDDPVARGLSQKVADARPRLESKGTASVSMAIAVVMSDLPDGGHLMCKAMGFKPAGRQAYGFEISWRPFDPNAR